VLIEAERVGAALDRLIGDEDDVVMAAVTAAELLVELEDGRRRRARERYVTDVLATIPTEPYDLDVARVHARLLAHTRKAGRPRGAHDLIIAATALTRGRTIVTADAPGFEDLPGIAVRSPAETAERERRRAGLAGEAAALARDPAYVREAREVAALMEALRGSR
jgi:tRNA(fMet)-specific endonuclease VapC